MKTIEEKAIEYTESKIKYEYDPGYFEDICKSFMKGVEFAQQMIDSNIDLPDENVTVLVESIIYDKKFYTVAYIFVCENGLKMWYDFHQYFKTKDTKWRPINLK